MKEWLCEYCNNSFILKYKNQRFCSKECFNKSRTKNDGLVCWVCGRIFKWKRRRQKYCSQKCKWLAHRRKNKLCESCWIEFYPSYASQKCCSKECGNKIKMVNFEKICPICSKEFLWSNKDQIYCCVTCANLWAKKYDNKECPVCWIIFYSSSPGAIYCSRQCSWEAHRTLKEKECLRCWKLFRPHDSTRVYCCLECWYKWVWIKLKENRKSLSAEEKEKKMSHLFNTCNTSNSAPNIYYSELFLMKWYNVSDEFQLWWYSFDFKIWDILIEINPFAYHNSGWAPKRIWAKPKHPMYHYNKTKCAIDNWYKIIHVWDWMPDNELFYIIENIESTEQTSPTVHRYHIKTKEHLTWDNYDDKEMSDKWYVKIYDWWEKYIFNSTKID